MEADMSDTIRDRAWQMIMESERFNNNDLANTLRLQYRTYKATRINGRPLPLALEAGESAIKPMIFESAAQALERMSGRLLSTSA